MTKKLGGIVVGLLLLQAPHMFRNLLRSFSLVSSSVLWILLTTFPYSFFLFLYFFSEGPYVIYKLCLAVLFLLFPLDTSYIHVYNSLCVYETSAICSQGYIHNPIPLPPPWLVLCLRLVQTGLMKLISDNAPGGNVRPFESPSLYFTPLFLVLLRVLSVLHSIVSIRVFYV